MTKLKNKTSGFTLVNLMIAVVIMSMTVLTASQVLVLFLGGKKSVDLRKKVNNYQAYFLDYLVKADTCYNNFASSLPRIDSKFEKKTSHEYKVSEFTFIENNNKSKFTMGKKDNFEFTNLITSAKDSRILEDIYIDKISISNILKSSEHLTRANGTLQVVYKAKSASSIAGPKTFTRSSNISFELDDSNRVIGCTPYGGFAYLNTNSSSIPSTCSPNEFIHYKDGVLICSKASDSRNIVNIAEVLLPCHEEQLNKDDIWGGDMSKIPSAFGRKCTTLSTRYSKAWKAAFFHSSPPTSSNGVSIFTYNYKAKSTGEIFIETTLPIRHWANKNGVENSFNIYLWAKRVAPTAGGSTLVGSGIMDNPLSLPKEPADKRQLQIGNSMGSTGFASGSLDVIKDHTYNITVRAGAVKQAGVNEPVYFIGSMKHYDHYVDAVFRITEMNTM